jgi:hypothetical protein
MTDEYNSHDRPLRGINETANQDFSRALFKGFWRDVFSQLTQRSNSLLPFDEVRQHVQLRGQHYAGLQQVPMEKIVGSVNRYQDFDRAFLPRQTFTKSRWMSIDRAHLMDENLPPVELYKIGDVYFVKDGNHRVSVGREKGQAFIDAQVIEIDVDIPVTAETNIADLILAQEKSNFNDITHLKELRPDSNVEPSLPGQYDRLLEHISVNRWYLGEQRQGEVPYEEAVASWYDNVYLPLVGIIRSFSILHEFPGRTEADLYLWIIEHYYYLTEMFQDDMSLEKAAMHFTSEYSQRPVRKIIRFLKRTVEAFGSDIDVENELYNEGHDNPES